MAKRRNATKSWKHVYKVRKQYKKYFEGEAIRTKNTDFMTGIDEDMWADYMAYDNTDDGVEEE